MPNRCFLIVAAFVPSLAALAYASPLPGPPVVHEPLATAPQLATGGIWSASPVLVSGTEAYADGEYLYQDFVYDDHGADTTVLPLPPNPEPDSNQFGASTGDVVYPTDVTMYGHNAADLLELRARVLPNELAYRIALNTMIIWIFPGFDHFAHGILDQWGPARDFLGDAVMDRRPVRVTYRRVLSVDNPTLGLIHDKAFWVFGIEVAPGEVSGLVDLRSARPGEPTPVVSGIVGAGTDPAPHLRRGIEWLTGILPEPVENALILDLEGVAAAGIDVDDARIDAGEPVRVVADSTHPVVLTLVSSVGTAQRSLPAGHSDVVVTID